MEERSSVRKDKRWWLAGVVLASVVLGIIGWSLAASPPFTAQAIEATRWSDQDTESASAPVEAWESAADSTGDVEQKEPNPTDGISGGGSRLPSPANPVASNSGGGVTVKATWKGPRETDGAITFLVVMDTHSIPLDGYDLSTMAVLRNDQGTEVVPLTWEAPSGGHHREGVLTFPIAEETGTPALGSAVRVVELVIRGLAGVPERVLTWEIS